MKKVISVLLALCMALSVLSVGIVTAYADGTVIPNTDVTWNYDSGTKVLTISGTGAIPDYKEVSEGAVPSYPWGSLAYTSVVFESGITAIGNYAFCSSKALESVTVPENVAVLGKGVFKNCENLEAAEINASCSIGESMFAGCTSLTSVKLSGSADTIGNSAFYNCISLSEIEIPEGVKSISDDAFSYCSGLEKAVISDTVKTIGGYAFYGCGSLAELELGSGLETIGESAFASCRSLGSVVIPENVKTISANAFNGCTGLTSVSLPDNLTSVGDSAFNNCEALKNVTIGYYVTKIGEKAFGFGKKGAKVTGFTVSGYNGTAAETYAKNNGFTFVSLGDYLNGSCGEEATWSFDDTNGTLTISGTGAMYDYTAENMPEYSRFAKKIKKIEIVSDTLTGIGDYAFYNMSVNDMFIPETVTEIGEKAIGNFTDGVINEGFKFSGFRDSAAENYAEENGIEFTDLRPIPTEGKCGEDAAWSYDAETKTLAVSGTGATYDYTLEELPEFAGYGFDIRNITVSDGITKIGSYALVLVELPEALTFGKDIAELGEFPFGYCRIEGEEGYEAAVAGELSVSGYSTTPVKAFCEENGFTFVQLDTPVEPPVDPTVTPEEIIESTFTAKADTENKVIFLCQLELAGADVIAKLGEAGYTEVTVSTEIIGTGTTLEIKSGEETLTYTFIIPGDTNGNGTVNSSDALDILNHSVESVIMTGNALIAGDINGDGVINSGDALEVLQIAVGQKEIASYLISE